MVMVSQHYQGQIKVTVTDTVSINSIKQLQLIVTVTVSTLRVTDPVFGCVGIHASFSDSIEQGCILEKLQNCAISGIIDDGYAV